MSDSKTVQIVTRSEVLAVCEGHLRRLDHAISFWIYSAERIGGLSDEEVAATLFRRRVLDAFVAEGKFTNLQESILEEISFLHADLERRELAAIEQAAQLRGRGRARRARAARHSGTGDARRCCRQCDLRRKARDH